MRLWLSALTFWEAKCIFFVVNKIKVSRQPFQASISMTEVQQRNQIDVQSSFTSTVWSRSSSYWGTIQQQLPVIHNEKSLTPDCLDQIVFYKSSNLFLNQFLYGSKFSLEPGIQKASPFLCAPWHTRQDILEVWTVFIFMFNLPFLENRKFCIYRRLPSAKQHIPNEDLTYTQVFDLMFYRKLSNSCMMRINRESWEPCHT